MKHYSKRYQILIVNTQINLSLDTKFRDGWTEFMGSGLAHAAPPIFTHES